MARVLWLLVLSAGCGRIGFGAGAPGDLAADAAPGVTPAAITVTVRGVSGEPDQGAPVAGASVVFESAGTVTRQLTDAAGVASQVVDTPTTIYVFQAVTSGYAVDTVVGVPPGAVLAVGPTQPPAPATLQITVPSLGTGFTYGVTGPVGCEIETQGTATTVPVAFDPVCAGQTHDLYARAASSSGAPLADWQIIPGVTLADGAGAQVATWVPAQVQHLTLTGLATDTQATVEYYAGAGADAVELDYGAPTQTATAGQPLGFDVPTIGATPTFAFASTMTTTTLQAIAVPYPVPGGQLDASALPAPITDVQLDTPSRTLRWVLDPQRSPSTFVAALVQRMRDDGQQVAWTVVAPPATRAVQVPALPADLEAIAPSSTTTVQGIIGLGFSDPTLPYLDAAQALASGGFAFPDVGQSYSAYFMAPPAP